MLFQKRVLVGSKTWFFYFYSTNMPKIPLYIVTISSIQVVRFIITGGEQPSDSSTVAEEDIRFAVTADDEQ